MPGEVIDRPNPGPPPSHLPDSVDELMVRLQTVKLDDNVRRSLEKFRRVTDYIAAAMIFLRSNAYLKRPVKREDIKPRLLGTLKHLAASANIKKISLVDRRSGKAIGEPVLV
ncbi:hypothetical protein McanMca71_007038 [Microsporum canis]